MTSRQVHHLDPLTEVAHLRFWRGLDELDGIAVSPSASSTAPALWRRRDVLKLMGASVALAGTAGCSRTPLEKIIPYREGPPEVEYGKPVFFASAVARDGYGCGVLVETNMGRPTKIEGNPLHPASLGATDAITQGAVLELWDPDRSKDVLRGRTIDTWPRFLTELAQRLERAPDGKGIRILTETVTSPTLHAQLRALLVKYPNARWHQYQPLHRDNVYEGSRVAFGAAYEPQYRFADAHVVVALDADIVGSMPGAVRYARDLSTIRRIANLERMGRVYVAEGTPSLTGALADHRHVARTSDIAALTQALGIRVGAVAAVEPGARSADAWLDAATRDLRASRGRSIVIAGDRQPASVHALVHAMNVELGNFGATVALVPPVAFEPASQVDSLRSLVSAMRAGAVETLVILGGNPVYHAPVDFDFADASAQVPWKAHLSLHDDETSASCTWHVPAAHPFETWSDLRAFDGSALIQQPCIRPLYDGHSPHELLSAMIDGVPSPSYDLVRGTWRAARPGDFEAFWRAALFRGVIDPPIDTAVMTPALRRDAISAIALPAVTPSASGESIELVFAPDPTLGDGRHANNAWLQELPKPLTTLTWDNAALMAPALARALGVRNEDVVAIECQGRSVRAPVWIMPGHAERSVTLYLGGGRTRAGTVGTAVGVNAFSLRTSEAPWFVDGVVVSKTDARHPLAPAQGHNRMEGRDLARMLSREEALRCVASTCVSAHSSDPSHSLYPAFTYDDYKWGMSIDLSSCIGCGACTIACQAENNIPVVGKDEVRHGRELHWIRVDRYYEGRPRGAANAVPAGAVHAVRARAVRGRVSGRSVGARLRRG